MTGLAAWSEELADIAQSVGRTVAAIRVQGPKGEGQGAGFLYGDDRHLLTNAHVVEGALAIEARFGGGQQRRARSVGLDRAFDLALLELDAPAGALPAPAGDSEALRPGNLVLAFGNPLGLSFSVSMGVVSALDRSLPIAGSLLDALIQTDASINPGNSGGPLCTVHGEVVGVTSLAVRGGQGLGFAIPMQLAAAVAEDLRTLGYARHPMIGVQAAGEDLDPAVAAMLGRSARGVRIAAVAVHGPADRAGLAAGDVIVSADGAPTPTPGSLRRALLAARDGGVNLTVERGAQTFTRRVDVVDAATRRIA